MDGTRISELIRAAQDDPRLRMQIYFCPEKAIEGRDFSPNEARAIKFGDLSQVDLSQEVLDMGHRLFNEVPNAGDMPPETAAVNVFAMKGGDDPCL